MLVRAVVRRLLCVCLVCLIVSLGCLAVPVSAVDSSELMTYTLSDQEMFTLLTAGRLNVYDFTTSEWRYMYLSTLPDESVEGIFWTRLPSSTLDSANASHKWAFEFVFPLDLKCFDLTITQAIFRAEPDISWNGGSVLVNPPFLSWNASILTTSTSVNQSCQNTVNQWLYPLSSEQFSQNVPITSAESMLTASSAVEFTADSVHFNVVNEMFSGECTYYYGIKNITYTATASEADLIQAGIENIRQEIINNGDKLDKLDESMREMITSNDKNAEDIIANQDKNAQEIKDQIWDSLYQAGNAVIDNDNKNHQAQLDHDEKLWNDTFNPSEEEVGDYAGAIFDDDIQDELKSKLGLFTFLDDTMQQLLSAFDDSGSAGTGLIMPALVVPIGGVEYTVIEETAFDMADTLDQIPVLVSAIRFVSGIIIIFGFLSYLHRLKVRFFGAD